MSGYSRKDDGGGGGSKGGNDGHYSRRLTTDRAAYISFLEGQLEQVSANSLLVCGFNDRIEQMHAQVTTLEEKMSTVSRSVKLLQQCSEQTVGGQEAYQAKVEEQIASAVSQCDELSRKVTSLENRPLQVEERPIQQEVAIESHSHIVSRLDSFVDKLAKLEARSEEFDRHLTAWEAERMAQGGHHVEISIADVESEIERQLAPLKTSMFFTEKTCSRLVDDALSAVEKNQKRMQEIKEELQHGLSALQKDFVHLETRGEKEMDFLFGDQKRMSAEKCEELERQMSARMNSKLKKAEDMECSTMATLTEKLQKVEELGQTLTQDCQKQMEKIESLEHKLKSEFGVQIAKVADLVKKVAAANNKLSAPEPAAAAFISSSSPRRRQSPHLSKLVQTSARSLGDGAQNERLLSVRDRAQSPGTMTLQDLNEDRQHDVIYDYGDDVIYDPGGVPTGRTTTRARRPRTSSKGSLKKTVPVPRGSRSLSARLTSARDRELVRIGDDISNVQRGAGRRTLMRGQGGGVGGRTIPRMRTVSAPNSMRNRSQSADLSAAERDAKNRVHNTAQLRARIRVQEAARRENISFRSSRTMGIPPRPQPAKATRSKFAIEQTRALKGEAIRRRNAIDTLYEQLRSLEEEEYGVGGPPKRR